MVQSVKAEGFCIYYAVQSHSIVWWCLFKREKRLVYKKKFNSNETESRQGREREKTYLEYSNAAKFATINRDSLLSMIFL